MLRVVLQPPDPLHSSRPPGASSSSQDDSDPQATLGMNSKRKADVLLKHRSAITRWTEDSSCRDRLQCSSTRIAADRGGTLSRPSEGSDEAEFSRHDLMRLAFKETLGRHLVANAAIPPGITLIRERPFAWSISREHSDEFCAHCTGEVRPAILTFSSVSTRRSAVHMESIPWAPGLEARAFTPFSPVSASSCSVPLHHACLRNSSGTI